MFKLKKAVTITNIIVFIICVLCELLNYLFQGVIYSYYLGLVDSTSQDEYWEIGLKYKNIGVVFSDITYYMLIVLAVLVALWIIVAVICNIMEKKDVSESLKNIQG